MIRRTSISFASASGAHALDLMVASTVLTRLRGLLGRQPLNQGEGILLRPCNLVHTVGMRYPIDVVFLRRDGLVLKVAPAVVPCRARGYLRAH